MYDKDTHIENLTVTNEALASKLASLNRRKMARNNEATNKWRRKAFYYKQKCTLLLKMLKNRGLEAPKEEDDESSY